MHHAEDCYFFFGKKQLNFRVCIHSIHQIEVIMGYSKTHINQLFATAPLLKL